MVIATNDQKMYIGGNRREARRTDTSGGKQGEN